MIEAFAEWWWSRSSNFRYGTFLFGLPIAGFIGFVLLMMESVSLARAHSDKHDLRARMSARYSTLVNYVNAHDGRLPELVADQDWKNWTGYYNLTTANLRDIPLETTNPLGGELLYNATVSGRKLADLPPNTVLMEETRSWPDGSRLRLYADGEVEFGVGRRR